VQKEIANTQRKGDELRGWSGGVSSQKPLGRIIINWDGRSGITINTRMFRRNRNIQEGAGKKLRIYDYKGDGGKKKGGATGRLSMVKRGAKRDHQQERNDTIRPDR